MKKIITHLNPDLDAVASVWLIKRFLPGWEKAEIEFVAAGGSTQKEAAVDQDPNILWVDVGRGKLDHHQTGEYLSAAKLCLDYIKEKRKGKKLSPLDEEALERMVRVVTEVDNAKTLEWKEVSLDRAGFYLHRLIWGICGLAGSDQEAMDFGLKGLEAVLLITKNKIRAEEEIKTGIEFETPWGKALALESSNDSTTWQAEEKGYCLAARKDPETGAVRIYARPDSGVDLTDAYHRFKEMDSESDWFLHVTKRILLNESGSKKMTPTKLTLEEIIEVLKR